MIFVCNITLHNYRIEVFRSFSRSGDLLVRSPSRYEPHHPTKFGGHRLCGCRDKIVLVCHVILQNHMIKELCYFVGRNPST